MSLAETDKLLSDMGYELDEDSLRAKYGEGYRRKPAPPAPPSLPAPGQPVVNNKKPDLENKPGSGEDDDDKPASFAEAGRQAASMDAMDELVDDALAEWEPLMNPLTQPLERFLDDAAAQGLSAAEVIKRLPAMLAEMDTSALTDSLTRTAFAAAAGGEAGIDEDGRA